MEEKPQTEETGAIAMNRAKAEALLARRQRRHAMAQGQQVAGAGAFRVQERAWELFKDRVDRGDDDAELARKGKQALAQAQAFEDATGDAVKAAMEAVVMHAEGELIEEPGQPFGPALRADKRHRGVVGEKDTPRVTPEDLTGEPEPVPDDGE